MVMDTEQAIRERHRFQDRVTEFLKLASRMTERELELALGRLLDMLEADPSQSLQVQIKGDVLRQYYDLRRQGERKQRTLARWLDGCLNEDRVSNVATFELFPDKQVLSQSSDSETSVSDMVKLLSR
jgi:hypothetical protein